LDRRVYSRNQSRNGVVVPYCTCWHSNYHQKL